MKNMKWISNNEIIGMHSNFNGEIGLLYEEIREYKKIKYRIKIRDNNIKKKKWYERWVVLEFVSEDTKTNLFRSIFFDVEPYLSNTGIRETLLWTDTRGRENKVKSLKEQIAIIEEIAKREIDYVFSLEYEIDAIIDEKINELKTLKLNYKKQISKLKGSE